MARNKHTLSNYRLLTANMGGVYPIGLMEGLPMDTIRHRASVFMRFSPMAAPVMHPITVRVHHFAVPLRILWPASENGGFEEFITSGSDGTNAETIPTMTATPAEGDLLDYLGLPLGNSITFSELPLRAFNMVWNEWFRDQDLATVRAEDDVTVPLCAWEKDYLTTARPWAQKGPAVTIPLGTTAPVGGIDTAGTGLFEQGQYDAATASGQSVRRGAASLYNIGEPMIADLENASGPDVVAFREALALQRYAEARARYGSRYVEYLRYLGANPRDSRLQRPEMLAGGSARVNISEVLQSANEAASDRFGVGDLYGHGVAATRSNAYTRTLEEHMYVLSVLSVRPKAVYTNGMHRTFMRRTRDEFWQKELEHVGQQEVWQGEVYADGTDDYDTFGYSDRYADYRTIPSGVSGQFRGTLDYWHLGRMFASEPALNESFVECDPSKRIFNVQSDDTLWVAVQHDMVARRLVSRNATPRVL